MSRRLKRIGLWLRKHFDWKHRARIMDRTILFPMLREQAVDPLQAEIAIRLHKAMDDIWEDQP